MKKFALVLFVLVGSATSALAQVNAGFLGYWKSEQTSVELVFFINSRDQCKIMAWDRSDGEVLEITNIVALDNVIKCSAYTKSTNWRIEGEYTLVDANTIEEKITNENGVVTVMYHRTK